MNKKFKKILIRRAEDLSIKCGMDLDGDIFEILGKKYYVDCLHGVVTEVKQHE